MSIIIAALLVAAETAGGQSTRPVTGPSPQWAGTEAAFVKAISDGDPALIASQLDSGATIRQFGDPALNTITELLERVGGGRIVAAHAYTGPPTGLPEDLAADFKAASGLPASVVQDMSVDDPARQHAADVAVKWVISILGVAKGEPIGLAVFVPPASTDSGAVETNAAVHPVFMLISARLDDQGQFKITHVVFGDPLR